jgi:hypothetical protein
MINLNDDKYDKSSSIFNNGEASPKVPNVELKKIEFNEQYNAWDFFFQDVNEGEIRMREWPVDYSRDGADKKETSQAKRFKHLLGIYLPAGTALPQASDSADLMEKCVNLLGTHYVGVKVRLKVVYNKKGYLEIPAYPPFMELMSVPEEKSVLAFSNIDLVAKPAPSSEADLLAALNSKDENPII